MATINNKLIHFKSKSDFLSRYADTTDGGDTYGDFLRTSIVFIQDAKQIWTHGTDYYCGSGPVALKSDLENLDKICFVDLVSELNIDILNILEGNYSPISSTAKTGTFQKMLTAIQNNQQIVGIYSIQEDSNVGYLRFESSFAQVSENTIFMYWYNSASIMILTISNQEAVNLNRVGILTTDQQYSGNKVLVSDNGQVVDESNITTTELNYLDGVTSNIQTQLNEKASVNSLNNYLPLTGGTLTDNLFFPKNAGILIVEGAGMGIRSTNNGDDPISINGGGTFLQITSASHFTVGGSQILTENNWSDYIMTPDTKNTTGTSNNASKLYLVGGLTQNSAGVITYSNTAVYTQSGQLYANKMNSVTGFYETSDARLKNFKDDIKALDVVSEIPTRYFTWKKDETTENSDPKLHIGTSAQEIQKIYPDLVTENEEGELSVDYARLSVIALAAIKELKKEIDALKSASVK